MHTQALPPGLLLSRPPSLSEKLNKRANELRCKLIKANYNTQFAQNASELAEFRRATESLVDHHGMDVQTLSDIFLKTVHFTGYDAYEPFIAKLLEKPCKASSIVDLLAPGLPDYIVESSSTSGGIAKSFPIYNLLPKLRSLDVDASSLTQWRSVEPVRRRTLTDLWSLWWDRMDVVDEDNRPVGAMYFTLGSGTYRRTVLKLDPEKDKEWMGTFVHNHTAPFAAAFLRRWRTFLLIHALFALASRSLESISTVFINTFVEFMRHLDAEYGMLVDCIANGAIPDLEGVEAVRHYLEANLSPDIERAAELRSIGRPSARPGWCGRAWPNLHSVSGAASGSFATSVPLAQWYLGSNADVFGGAYGCTEASLVGLPYSPRELNLYKLSSHTVFEFMNIRKARDVISSLAQVWEVEMGERYEIVVTTDGGLWRYRLGDVVEIAGFDPIDGSPIIRFVERRNVIIRFPDFMITEKELRAAMLSVSEKTFTNIVDWTAMVDNQRMPPTIGFFVELAADEALGIASGPPADHVCNALSKSNANVSWALSHGSFGKPIIWLVRRGTFSEFRQMKLDENGKSVGLGQIKVPSVLPKDAYVTWFLDRIVRELLTPLACQVHL